MKYSITILEPHFDQLLSAVFSKPAVEGAAYLLCGRSRTGEEERLLVQEVVPVKEEHYLRRTDSRLSICSDSYVPVAKKANERKQSVLFVHSHPPTTKDFSPQDNEEEPRLMEFFGRRAPEGTHGAVVISGSESLTARITRASQPENVFRVRVIGRRFRFFDATVAGETPVPHCFDRQVLAFGPEVQRLLARLHVAIVGVGGTGSAVFEQLV